MRLRTGEGGGIWRVGDDICHMIFHAFYTSYRTHGVLLLSRLLRVCVGGCTRRFWKIQLKIGYSGFRRQDLGHATLIGAEPRAVGGQIPVVDPQPKPVGGLVTAWSAGALWRCRVFLFVHPKALWSPVSHCSVQWYRGPDTTGVTSQALGAGARARALRSREGNMPLYPSCPESRQCTFRLRAADCIFHRRHHTY